MKWKSKQIKTKIARPQRASSQRENTMTYDVWCLCLCVSCVANGWIDHRRWTINMYTQHTHSQTRKKDFSESITSTIIIIIRRRIIILIEIPVNGIVRSTQKCMCMICSERTNNIITIIINSNNETKKQNCCHTHTYAPPDPSANLQVLAHAKTENWTSPIRNPTTAEILKCKWIISLVCVSLSLLLMSMSMSMSYVLLAVAFSMAVIVSPRTNCTLFSLPPPLATQCALCL